jgi:GT2 family glycosyltransferase
MTVMSSTSNERPTAAAEAPAGGPGGGAHAADTAGKRRRYAVVIVHYKTPEMLADCLRTLTSELDPGQRDEVVVVDNASGADHVNKVRALLAAGGGDGHGRVTLIESDKNLGFAGANNVGIRRVLADGGADYFVLLNPDTLVRPGAFATLLRFLRAHPEAACVGPRLEYPDGTPQLSAFGDPTPLSELVRGANIGVLSRLLKRWEVYGAVKEAAHRTDWVAGACVMMRADVVETVGLLDDKFFMYYEEVDYFRRARKAGLETWYEPAAHVVHLVGQASGVTTDWSARRLPAYWFESRHRYFRKHFGYLGMLAADGMWFTGHVMMRVRKLFTGVSHSAVAKSETGDLFRHAVRQALRPRRGLA